ncbi:MAG: hypothetical protein PHY72_00660 [Candidatus Pacebacteria bacterium]|nr:hypothetical protein [Candidatus Paceibacterota bacterium]
MNTNKIFQSSLFKGFLFGLLGFLILVFVFKVGEIVGIKKADFSCRWSNNYHQNFGGPRQGFMQGFGDRDFIEANGVVGQIIQLGTSTISIKGRGDIEKIVVITASTTINSLNQTIQISDLKVDDMLVVIGQGNNQGQIEAKLIRVMPVPPVGFLGPNRNKIERN